MGIKIANSINVAQSKAKKQTPHLIHSLRVPSKIKKSVDESKKFLEELGLNTDQFNILVDCLPQAVAVYRMVHDQKGKPANYVLLASNKAYDQIHPFKRERIGKKAAQFNPELKKDSVDCMRIYADVAKTGVPKTFEICHKPEDKWYKIYVYSPKKTFFIAIFMDITEEKKRAARELEEQKKSEDQLRFSEKRYRRLYETTQDGIMARDQGGKMIDCNLAYAKMLGYSKKELRNMSVKQLLPEKWFEQREKIVKRVLQTGKSIVFEREYRRKDGSIFPASVRTWRLTDGKGKVVGIWSIVRDITEQKENQKNLEVQKDYLKKVVDERTEQLKNTERLVAIGQTAGMVGHDLRNPLQTVIGELYLAKSEVKSLPEGEAKSNLQESIHAIEEQAVYMDKIVSDLQAFVQPVKIDKKPINLKDLVNNVLASVATPKNIIVQARIADDISHVKADLNLLKRVLINLVTNSVQAMPDGGKLTLTGQLNSEDQVSVTVQDTGVGIAESIKSQIFTPLFTTKPRGQGFGLAVCKRVIEAHGGNISFESAEGKGAKFSIQFPAN